MTRLHFSFFCCLFASGFFLITIVLLNMCESIYVLCVSCAITILHDAFSTSPSCERHSRETKFYSFFCVCVLQRWVNGQLGVFAHHSLFTEPFFPLPFSHKSFSSPSSFMSDDIQLPKIVLTARSHELL